MKSGTQSHLKTRRLQKRLKVPLYQVIGLLESIWLLCLDCCDEGNIGKFSDEEIAEYIEWEGPQSPSELLQMLADTGWLDVDTEFRYVVHDWYDHAPEFVKERIRKRRARQLKKEKVSSTDQGITTYGHSEQDNTGRPQDNTGHDRTEPELPPFVPSIPNPTQPNQTQPNKTLPPPKVPGGQEEGGLVSLISKAGVDRADEALEQALRRGCTRGEVVAAVMAFSKLSDVGPGLLYHKLMHMEPGEPATRRFPPPGKSDDWEQATRESLDPAAPHNQERQQAEAEREEFNRLEATHGASLDAMAKPERLALVNRLDKPWLVATFRSSPKSKIVRFELLRLLDREVAAAK